MASPARKRLSESVEEVAGDGGEMIGVSNTKRAKVAVADGGMGSGSIIGLPKTKGGVRSSGYTVIRLGNTIIRRPKAKPAEIPKGMKIVKKNYPVEQEAQTFIREQAYYCQSEVFK